MIEASERDGLINKDTVIFEPDNAAVLAGGMIGTHLQMGIGDGFIPKNLNCDIYEHIQIVIDREAITASKGLARLEGIMYGISSITNVGTQWPWPASWESARPWLLPSRTLSKDISSPRCSSNCVRCFQFTQTTERSVVFFVCYQHFCLVIMLQASHPFLCRLPKIPKGLSHFLPLRLYVIESILAG